MTSLRKMLTKKEFNFDYEYSRIIYHPTDPELWPGGARVCENSVLIKAPWDHPILDKEFSDRHERYDIDDEYRWSNMPRIVAEDNKYIYFPIMSSYDEWTYLECINKNLDDFIGAPNFIDQTPYLHI